MLIWINNKCTFVYVVQLSILRTNHQHIQKLDRENHIDLYVANILKLHFPGELRKRKEMC